jgi:hypothetical protein
MTLASARNSFFARELSVMARNYIGFGEQSGSLLFSHVSLKASAKIRDWHRLISVSIKRSNCLVAAEIKTKESQTVVAAWLY